LEARAELVLQEAQALHFNTIGTLGILIKASQAGLLDLGDALARLRRAGFHASEGLLESLLTAEGKGGAPKEQGS
jgi:predicted nucleic acid-binding protein